MKLIRPKTKIFVRVLEGAILYDQVYHRPARTLDKAVISMIPAVNNDTGWRWDKAQEGEVLLENDHYVDAAFVEPVKFPTLTKDKRGDLVNGSIWEVEEDMLAVYGRPSWGPCSSNVQTMNGAVIPKGTKVKMINVKGQATWGLLNEVSIDVEMDGIKYKLPKRFVGGMKCVKEGKTKVYWKLLNQNGDPVRSKRYKNLAAVKSAVRIITGVVSDDAIADIGWSDNAYDINEKFDDWVAVEYDYKTESEIRREDLSEWFTMHKLEYYE